MIILTFLKRDINDKNNNKNTISNIKIKITVLTDSILLETVCDAKIKSFFSEISNTKTCNTSKGFLYQIDEGFFFPRWLNMLSDNSSNLINSGFPSMFFLRNHLSTPLTMRFFGLQNIEYLAKYEVLIKRYHIDFMKNVYTQFYTNKRILTDNKEKLVGVFYYDRMAKKYNSILKYKEIEVRNR